MWLACPPACWPACCARWGSMCSPEDRLSGLSSTFFIFLIPSPDRLDDSLTSCISQAPLFLRFRRNSWYDTTVVRICQQFFSKFLKFFLRSQNFRVYYFYIYNSSNMFNPILSLYKKQEHTENTVSNTLLLSELYFFAPA